METASKNQMMDRQEDKRVAKVESTVDWTALLPLELQHAIVSEVCSVCLVSVVRLCLTGRAMYATVASMRVNVETWTNASRTSVPLLPLVRLAREVGVRRVQDVTTALALTVMHAYVAGAIDDSTCWYERGLEARGDPPSFFKDKNLLDDRLGLPSVRAISPRALVHWITSNHRTVAVHTSADGPPVLFPRLDDVAYRGMAPWHVPRRMCKRQPWDRPYMAVVCRELCAIGGALDDRGLPRATFTDIDRLDLLFGMAPSDMTVLIDLPADVVQRYGGWACYCGTMSRTCFTCHSKRRITDAFARPEAETRVRAYVDQRARAWMPSNVDACIGAVPQCDLALSDLFCVSDLHITSNGTTALFFGTVEARFDVPRFLAAASRLYVSDD